MRFFLYFLGQTAKMEHFLSINDGRKPGQGLFRRGSPSMGLWLSPKKVQDFKEKRAKVGLVEAHAGVLSRRT